MYAVISNFRGGKSTQKSNQVIIRVEGVCSRAKASMFIGKKLVWKSPRGSEIHGKVVSPHGNSGAMRARFSRGLPGQVLGKKVRII